MNFYTTNWFLELRMISKYVTKMYSDDLPYSNIIHTVMADQMM